MSRIFICWIVLFTAVVAVGCGGVSEDEMRTATHEMDERTDTVYARLNEVLDKNTLREKDVLTAHYDRGRTLFDERVEQVESLVAPYTKIEHALCTSDYWLSSLWTMMLDLVSYVEGDNVTLENIRAYTNGLTIDRNYGVGDPTVVCIVDEAGSWEVK